MIDGNGESTFNPQTAKVFPQLAARNQKRLSIPRALVLSGDDCIRRTLEEVLILHGVSPVFAAKIEESACQDASGDLNFCICQDKLADGKYEDLAHPRLPFSSAEAFASEYSPQAISTIRVRVAPEGGCLQT
jgi:hypothetical protein